MPEETGQPELFSPVAVLARLRALVAYLGEAEQFDWWRTSFLSPTGLRLLEYNFPRTRLSAGVVAASHAAKRLHDERIASTGAHHLFRLPHDLEVRIHGYLVGDGTAEVADMLTSRDAALAAMRLSAQSEERTGVGPVRISTIGRISHRPSLRKVAATYLHAFDVGDTAFPYFTDT